MAAAYAAVASLNQLVDEVGSINLRLKVGSIHLRLDYAEERKIYDLLDQLKFLMEQLGDYSYKGDKAVERVERLIRDAAYKAQDFLQMEMSRKSFRQSRDVIERSFHSITTTLTRWNVNLKIRRIKRQLQAIKESQRNEHLQPNYGSSGIRASEQTPTGGNTMVGFDSYPLSIKEQLCGSSSQFQVISIVGIAGIGKTTLAKNIFDDSLIVYHFDCRAWVTVSQNYDIKLVLQSLLKFMGLEIKEEKESVLKEKIYKHFKGRRYLVIIDDIWSKEVWDDLRHILPDDCNGSRIVLTTRLLDVAQYTSSSSLVHEIQFLNEEDSWSLLQQKVFVQDCCPLELENIGKFIASKCYGLPLAIVAIAGILSNVRQQHKWEEIATNMGTILSGTNKHLFDVLSLSYNHMPHQLKTCFLYMGIFPEDYEISVSNLIWLWVAEGFLTELKSTILSDSIYMFLDKVHELERLGEECLADLVKRNLVLITKKRANGQFKSCVLHDLVRDFCRQKALHEEFFVINNKDEYLNPKGVKSARNLTVHHGVQMYPLRPSEVAHSFHWFCESHLLQSSFHKIKWDRCKSLRVWSTCNIDGRESDSIPDVFSQMLFLKYLCYHGNIFLQDIHLPPSLSMLKNLQTLIIHAKFSSSSIELPPEIWKMTKLRHVMINKMVLPPLPPVGFNGLYLLQTLVTVLNFTFTKEVTRKIPALKKLKTHYWESEYNDGTEWQRSLERLMYLIHLTQLTELEIRYDAVFYHRVEYIPFPSGFSFPRSLEKLSLRGCRAPWKDLSLVGSLPNLQVLRLRYDSFVGDEWEPIEGEFSRLKFLLLESLDLKYWQAENSHFPCLEHLKIRECKELKGISVELGDIPTLKFIDIFESDFVEESAIQIRADQENWGNNMLQVRLGYR